MLRSVVQSVTGQTASVLLLETTRLHLELAQQHGEQLDLDSAAELAGAAGSQQRGAQSCDKVYCTVQTQSLLSGVLLYT